MKFTADEVMRYVQEEDVKFIRLAFCDIFGTQKNIALMPGQLPLAFARGIPADTDGIAGGGGKVLLRPDPATLVRLPWRPESGKVVRMFCDVLTPGGTPLATDGRAVLRAAAAAAEQAGMDFTFGVERTFYLFRTAEDGSAARIPYDTAGYLDIAPDDRGENVRREVCLTLEQMQLRPESSHHAPGPGQNQIIYAPADPITAADDAVTFCGVVKTIAARSGLWADFSPAPLEGAPGNTLRIALSLRGDRETAGRAIAGRSGVLADFLGGDGRPVWDGEREAWLLSVRTTVNPYLAFALLLRAALDSATPDGGFLAKYLPPAALAARG